MTMTMTSDNTSQSNPSELPQDQEEVDAELAKLKSYHLCRAQLRSELEIASRDRQQAQEREEHARLKLQELTANHSRERPLMLSVLFPEEGVDQAQPPAQDSGRRRQLIVGSDGRTTYDLVFRALCGVTEPQTCAEVMRMVGLGLDPNRKKSDYHNVFNALHQLRMHTYAEQVGKKWQLTHQGQQEAKEIGINGKFPSE